MDATVLTAGWSGCSTDVKSNSEIEVDRYVKLDEAASRPVLQADLFPDPLIIETVELLRYQDNFICRIRTIDGAEGISVSNNMQMVALYPIFVRRLQNFFTGKDARDLENLLEEVYVHQSNYKLQNLALWVPLATLEFAILDMLKKLQKNPLEHCWARYIIPELRFTRRITIAASQPRNL